MYETTDVFTKNLKKEGWETKIDNTSATYKTPDAITKNLNKERRETKMTTNAKYETPTPLQRS